MLAFRPPDSTAHLFFLFSFQLSFLLRSKLGLLLFFPFAYISFSFITHIYFSLFENDLRRTVIEEPFSDFVNWIRNRLTQLFSKFVGSAKEDDEQRIKD